MINGVILREHNGILYVGRNTTVKVLITFNEEKDIPKEEQHKLLTKLMKVVDIFDENNAKAKTTVDETISIITE